ncbi:hypothetical protein F5878DRAFT_666202 [Lentinula raphanica]|uniref:Uncharacterized protein n=1 Tax=Lentinula raphanica TaxID=153919 RepID=A0AA38NYF0_9AGAR|nr:hypothetical protein F5878DRAFT_666202 [Lentinula raphanica]
MIEQGGYSDSTAQKEKEAFRRMLVDYRCIPTNMIVEEFMLHDLQLATLSIACHAQHVSAFQRLPTSNQCLFEHKKLLYYSPKSSTVHAWVHAVINNIQAIEFVKDWLEESAEWKKNFRHALATHFYRDEYHWIELSIFPSKKKDKLRRQLYTWFCKKHDKVIVRRKQILQFYELFGPTILLDPTWLLLTKQGYPRQSKLWCDHVHARIVEYGQEDEDIGHMRYWNHHHFLLHVINALGGPSAKNYIEEFFNHNMPWVLDPLDDPKGK